MAVRKDAIPHAGRAAKKIGDAAKKGKVVKIPRAKQKKSRKGVQPSYAEAPDVEHTADVMIGQDAFRFRALAQAKILFLKTTAERITGCLDGTVKSGRYPRKFRYKPGLRYDFLVEVAGPRWDRASDEEKTRIAYHALRHLGSDTVGRWITEPHDIEGFVTEVEQFGLRDSRWAKVAEQMQLFGRKEKTADS